VVVGLCRVVLSLPWNDSLKGKRSVVKSILERARGRFQVAAAEVADHDAHRRATLGFAVVSNDVRHARSILDKLISFAATATQAQLIDQSTSVEHVDLGTGLSVGGLPALDSEIEDWEDEDWKDDDGGEEEN
jgi:uncharacterized protein YlxP (DUF503 family)